MMRDEEMSNQFHLFVPFLHMWYVCSIGHSRRKDGHAELYPVIKYLHPLFFQDTEQSLNLCYDIIFPRSTAQNRNKSYCC